MADATVTNYMRRFLTTRDAIEDVYQQAFAAYQERALEVVITSASFEGGSSSGQMPGNPKDIMDACEQLLTEMDAADNNEILPTGPSHVDFSKRRVGT